MTSETELFQGLQNAMQDYLDKRDNFLLEGVSSFDALFAKFYGSTNLDDLKNRFAQGDSMALLAAIGKCLGADTQAPDWVRCGFLGAFWSYRSGVSRTLDEAFHVERKSNWRRKRALKNRLDLELWRRIEIHKPLNPNESDRDSFEAVAKTFNDESSVKFRGFEKDFNITVNWRDVEAAFNRIQDFIDTNPNAQILREFEMENHS